MKKIDPLGRNMKTGFEAYSNEVSPRACWCSPGDTFASAKGKYDNCENCGCTCYSGFPMVAGGRPTASETNRAS